MNKLKKVICLSLMLSLILSTFGFQILSVGATSSDLTAEIELLNYLNILEKNVELNSNLTRKEAAKIMVAMNKYPIFDATGQFKDVALDDPYASYIETAYKNGLVSMNASKTFRPNDTIRAIELVKMLLHSCGYGAYLDYQNSLSYAKTINLLKGVDTLYDDTLVNMSQAIRLINNALELDMMVAVSVESEGDIKYQVVKGKTILSTLYDIIKVEGVMTANDLTSIYSENGGVGGIAIDGNVYSCDTLYRTYLGYNVCAYINTIENEVAFLTAASNKNKTFRIKSDDVLSTSNKSKISYYDKNDRIQNIKVKGNASYFINDIYFANMSGNLVSSADLRRENSVYVFLDNNNDGTYDFVFEEQYRYFQIKSKDQNGKFIIDKIEKRTIDIIDKDVFRYMDGTAIPYENLKYNDVLGVKVANSFDFSNRMEGIDFVVINNVINGTAYKSSEKSINIDGITYNLNILKANDLNGKQGSFYLDANGRIVAYDASGAEIRGDYAYLAKIGRKEQPFLELKAKILSQKEGLKTVDIDDKVSVYSNNMQMAGNITALAAMTNEIVDKVIKIEYSSEGKIKRIDLPKQLAYGQKGIKDDFNYVKAPVFSDFSGYRRRGEDIYNDLYRLPNTSTAFVVPENDIDDKIYGVKTVSQISIYEDITFDLYNVNDEFVSNFVVVREKEAGSGAVNAEGSIFVVDELTASINKAGESTYTVYGMYNGERKAFQFLNADAKAKSFTDENIEYAGVKREHKPKDLGCGDVLLLNLDGDTINSFRVLLDVSSDPHFARQGSGDWDDVCDWPIAYPMVNKAMLLVNGVVDEKEGEVLTYHMTVGGKTYTKNLFTTNVPNVYIVDLTNEKMFKSDINDKEIIAGRKIFSTMLWGRERDIVIYK